MNPETFLTAEDLAQARKTINLNGAVVWTRDETKLQAKKQSLHELFERYWPQFTALSQDKAKENSPELRMAATMVYIYQQSILKIDEQLRVRQEVDAEDSE